MFAKTQFQTLFAYHWNIRSRLLVGAGKLEETDYRTNPGYGHGSVHDLLFHLLRTENTWRLALETGQQITGIQPLAYPSLAEIVSGTKQEQEAWQAFLDQLSDKDIEDRMMLTDRRGEVHGIPRWRILNHMVLHGMQHHSELAQLLTVKGQSPGDIDFIFFG